MLIYAIGPGCPSWFIMLRIVQKCDDIHAQECKAAHLPAKGPKQIDRFEICGAVRDSIQ
jgi:hypothetical protein